jgi:DNA invertase Pin-like site-specific DNA recombinase
MPSYSSPPIAYSYIRFSTPEQAQGDSLRRQTEAAAEWCQRNGVTLDASTTLHALGKSAYTGAHRQNADRNALAHFLKLVEAGKVPRGSYLIIENLDRLSREHIQPALLLVLNLLQAGIRIVQLKPTELMFDDKSDTLPVMMMMVELSRGHSESAMKSDRNGKAWAEKKACARRRERQPPRKRDRVNGMALMTHQLPAWVEEQGGALVLIPERAEVVRQIFALTAAGYGQMRIAARLTREGVSPFGTLLAGGEAAEHRGQRAAAGVPLSAAEEHALSSWGRWETKRHPDDATQRLRVWKACHWTGSYIHSIVFDRRALGEFQPSRLADDRRGRVPDGEPIANYFPAAVQEAEWLAARAAVATRRKHGAAGPARPWTEEEDDLIRSVCAWQAARKTGRTRAAIASRLQRLRAQEAPAGAAAEPAERHFVNVFAGLLRNARDGSSYNAILRNDGGGRRHVLMNASSIEGRAPCVAFPFAVFEAAVLSRLREIDPHEILNGDHGPDETQVLAGRLERVRQSIALITNEMDEHGESPALFKRLRAKEEEEGRLNEQHAQAQLKARYPLSASWGEFQSLAEALEKAPDPTDARLRLRSALLRIVGSIYLLIVRRGLDRLAAVQVYFAGVHKDRCRSYLIYARAPRSNGKARREGGWRCRSLADLCPTAEDLHDRGRALALEQALQALDVDALWEAMAPEVE